MRFKNYRLWLKSDLNHAKKGMKSIKTKFSEFIGCHPTFLSQVLSGKVNLTLEQAILANEFFERTSFESEYFMLLVERERAGSKKLEDFFQKRIDVLLDEQDNLKNRFSDSQDIPADLQSLYYSAWYYSAVHVCLSIESYQSTQVIAQRLNISVSEVNQVIEMLLNAGLIEYKNKKYELSTKNLYLGRDKVAIKHHHVNWRSQSLRA